MTTAPNDIRKFIDQFVLDRAVAERMRNYVYGLYAPGEQLPFYVGKGKGQRVLQHFEEAISAITTHERRDKIRAIFEARGTPSIRILRHGIQIEATAFAIESALIDTLAPSANRVLGHGSDEFGMRNLSSLTLEFAAKAIEKDEIRFPCVFIKINKLWDEKRLDLTPDDGVLYEITRKAWDNLNLRRLNKYAKVAFAVAHGLVREAYEVEHWQKALKGNDNEDYSEANRVEFIGKRSSNPEIRQFVGRSFKKFYVKGAQRPVIYLNAPTL